jgi:hypothetical protein
MFNSELSPAARDSHCAQRIAVAARNLKLHIRQHLCKLFAKRAKVATLGVCVARQDNGTPASLRRQHIVMSHFSGDEHVASLRNGGVAETPARSSAQTRN